MNIRILIYHCNAMQLNNRQINGWNVNFIIKRGVMSFFLCGLFNDTFGFVAI
jgi:hypothetical protein